MQKLFIYLPRVLAIALTLFISMFALDVFSEGYVLPDLLVAAFMHLLPTIILVALTVFAWQRPKWGGVAFLLATVAAGLFFNFYIASPLFLIGILFIVSHKLALKN